MLTDIFNWFPMRKRFLKSKKFLPKTKDRLLENETTSKSGSQLKISKKLYAAIPWIRRRGEDLIHTSECVKRSQSKCPWDYWSFCVCNRWTTSKWSRRMQPMMQQCNSSKPDNTLLCNQIEFQGLPSAFPKKKCCRIRRIFKTMPTKLTLPLHQTNWVPSRCQSIWTCYRCPFRDKDN